MKKTKKIHKLYLIFGSLIGLSSLSCTLTNHKIISKISNKSVNSNDVKASNINNFSLNDEDITVPAETFFSGKEIKGSITYTINPSNSTQIVIKGYSQDFGIIDPTFKDEININGKKYTNLIIYENAFENCTNLKGILTFSSIVTSIGENFDGSYYKGYSFSSCTNLTSVDLSKSDKISLVHYGNFADCKKLSNVSLPDSITNLGMESFYGCPLTNIQFTGNSKYSVVTSNNNKGKLVIYGDNKTEWDYSSPTNGLAYGEIDMSGFKGNEIPYNMFHGCAGITSIILPDISTKIEGYAFDGCYLLNSINLKNIKFIDDFAFYGCTSLDFVDLENANLIGCWAFSKCSETSINLKNCYSLDASAFNGCTKLNNVSLSSNLTKIPFYCFKDCLNLQTINLDDITLIQGGAFDGCKNLKTIALSANMVEIPDSCFASCYNLHTINLDNITSIGRFAFQNCSALATIELSNIQSIGLQAFYNCTGLRNIIFGSSLKQISYTSFNNCTSISSVTFNYFADQIYDLKSDTFDNKWMSYALGSEAACHHVNIYVPYGMLSLYEKSEVKEKLGIQYCLDNNFLETTYEDEVSSWISDADGTIEYGKLSDSKIHIIKVEGFKKQNPIITNKVKIGNKDYTIDGITEKLFQNNINITGSLTIDNSITSIGSCAFDECDGITEINLNWTKEQLESFFADSNSPINSNWLSSLNNPNIPVNVPGKYMSSYLKYAKQLGIDQCQIQGDINSSDWVFGAEGTIKAKFNVNNKSFEIIDAKRFACVNPTFTNAIQYDSATYICNKIPDDAFNHDSNNSGISGIVTIDNSITSIGKNAFNGCYNIEGFCLLWNDADLKKIVENQTINSLWLGDLNKEEHKTLIYIDGNDIDSYTQYQTLLGINECDWVDEDCDASKVINNSLGTCWLNDTTRFVSLKLVKLNENLFNGSLKNSFIAGEKETKITGIESSCFANLDKLYGNFTLPNTITHIGANAFANCANLKSITLTWNEDQLKQIFTDSSNDNLIDPNWLGENNNYKIIVPHNLKKVYEKYRAQLGIVNNEIMESNSNLSLILGLSLGLGIPILAGAITGTVIGIKKHHNKTAKK